MTPTGRPGSTQPGTRPPTETPPATQLKGIKVADFSAVMAGPYCTRMLADLGADVIKVEPPGGEHTRSVMPQRQGQSDAPKDVKGSISVLS